MGTLKRRLTLPKSVRPQHLWEIRPQFFTFLKKTISYLLIQDLTTLHSTTPRPSVFGATCEVPSN